MEFIDAGDKFSLY